MLVADIVQWSTIAGATLTTLGNVIVFFLQRKGDNKKLLIEFKTRKFLEMKELRSGISLNRPLTSKNKEAETGKAIICLYNHCSQTLRNLEPYFSENKFLSLKEKDKASENVIYSIETSGGIDNSGVLAQSILEFSRSLDMTIGEELRKLGKELSRM